MIKSNEPERRWGALLSKQETAEYLSISTRTLNRLMAEKLLQPVAIGSLLRFRRSDVDGYIESLPSARGRVRIVSRAPSNG